MDQKLRTERRKLADLKAAEYNPRKALTPDDAEYQKIRRSIEEFGYVDPIIINEDGTIIGGHQRATVLKDLGYQEVDVVVVALDKQREKALNIALNKITGEWDEVKLKDLLLDLDLGDYDISLTGFEQNDLTELVDKLAIEPCLYGWKEGAAHYFINDRTQDTVILEDDIDFSAMKKNELVAYLEELRRKNRDQTSVIYENKPTRNDIHPTMKPIALVGKFITNSSKSGWNVLDLFGGSGSTLMAAEQLGRTAFIMELDERFCDVIVKRWEDYTGQQAVRIPAEDVK